MPDNRTLLETLKTDTDLWVNTQAFAEKLFQDIRKLSRHGAGVTREAYGSVETAAIEYLRTAGSKLGLAARSDAAGNLWLDQPGTDSAAAAVVLGSHADSVPEGGNYDGLAGIVAGLCVLKALRDSGVQLARPVSVLALRGEENSFYGKPYLGSRALLGLLEPEDIRLVNRDGVTTLAKAMRRCGLIPEKLVTGKPLIDLKFLACFIELHIEQGPILDMEPEKRTGIVTGIRGLYSHKAIRCERVDCTAPYDAVVRATTELLVRMEVLWQSELNAGRDLVETTGIISMSEAVEDEALFPIPHLDFSFDIRSLDHEECLRFHAFLQKEALEVGVKRGVRFVFDPLLESHPARMDEELQRVLHKAAAKAGVPVRPIASGAGHDSAYFANAGVPTAMLFVANQKGSHNPHEDMKMTDFMAGVKVLAYAVPQLAG